MHHKAKLTAKVAVLASAATVAAVATTTVAAPAGWWRDCLPGVYCLDVYQPVICSNGFVYSNSCYAAKACATGCVPYEVYE